MLVIAAAIDAGYSVAWSRIGVLSKAQEVQVQQLLGALGAFHLLCGAVTARAASRKGLPVAPAVAKACTRVFCLCVLLARPSPHDVLSAAHNARAHFERA